MRGLRLMGRMNLGLKSIGLVNRELMLLRWVNLLLNWSSLDNPLLGQSLGLIKIGILLGNLCRLGMEIHLQVTHRNLFLRKTFLLAPFWKHKVKMLLRGLLPGMALTNRIMVLSRHGLRFLRCPVKDLFLILRLKQSGIKLLSFLLKKLLLKEFECGKIP